MPAVSRSGGIQTTVRGVNLSTVALALLLYYIVPYGAGGRDGQIVPSYISPHGDGFFAKNVKLAALVWSGHDAQRSAVFLGGSGWLYPPRKIHPGGKGGL